MTTLTQLSTKAPTLCDHPEVELLLCCARTHIEPKTAARIRTLLQQDINWAYLIQTAAQHGIIPLLYQSLSTTCPEAVPKPVLSQLRSHFHARAFQNLFLTKELLLLKELFEVNSIPAIPYKGPVLAAWVYGNLALRQFGDLDILVHERDFLQAKKLLISQGYRMLNTSEHEAAHLQAELWRDDDRVVVDLHYGIPPRRSQFNSECLWECRQPVTLATTTVLTFTPEHTLLFLCVNAAKESWKSLNQICDIAQLLRTHPELDWSQVLEQQLCPPGVTGLCIFPSLLIANELLEIAVPEEVWQRIQVNPLVKLYVAQVCKRLREKPLSEKVSSLPLDDFEYFLFNFTSEISPNQINNGWYLVWHFLRSAFTPTERDQEFLPLPSSLSSLYYLVRPIRLLGKWGLNPVKRLLGGK